MAGGPKVDGSGQIVRRERGIYDTVRALTPEIRRALPKLLDAERMTRIVLSAIRTTPKLAECTEGSFMASMFASMQLGLEPNTPLGHGWLIPYGRECKFILGYQGMRELAFRTGRITGLRSRAVYRGDRFVYVLGDDERIEHEPLAEDRTDDTALLYTYAIGEIRDAEKVREVLTRGQIEQRKKRSATSKSGPWVSDFAAMAKKSAVRAIWPQLPRSAEMGLAEDIDQRIEDGRKLAPALIDSPAGDVLEKLGHMPAHDPETGEVPIEDELEMVKS